MNLAKLKKAEAAFLKRNSQGFLSEEMQEIGKKHRVPQMVALSQDCFKKSRLSKPRAITDDMVRVVSTASMVSMFEKPKFRDFVNALPEAEIKLLACGLKNFLHGNQQKGFDEIVDTLLRGKLAKWSLVTIIPNYFRPDDEVFVKLTTAKGVIEQFELEGLQYHPRPTWEFYEEYRKQILDMRSRVDDSLSPNNAAFCGFLMMSLKQVLNTS